MDNSVDNLESSNRWKNEFAEFKNSVQRSLKYGEITQEEAEEAIQEWLCRHPDPDQPES